MAQQLLTIEEFNKLLQQWNGKMIKVSKQELDDYDESVLQLHSVSYGRNTRRIDDYQPMHTLQLNGDGKMLTDAESSQPLPDQLYEIPIEDSTLYQFDESQFSLTTDRGTYTIEIASELE
ncbi:hypothetical protein [Sediminibacillus albus]|uniref:Uncharacterized protein n=1 Tax=Sediminibacillus albus TaxID=407036 RepID=A0A1G8X544_9BACI|nr:hypothetical protein [Sediminibacillus albus]SDJ85673.1 hypothetical protein SAMN05216243_1166 [Sediminibacillus albus]